MFRDKVVVITGGAGGIGKCIREEFEKAGARVCVIDIADNPDFVGDIGDEATLRRFAEKVIAEHGRVDCLIMAINSFAGEGRIPSAETVW